MHGAILFRIWRKAMFRSNFNIERFLIIAAIALLFLPAASIALAQEDPGAETPDPVVVEEETANADNPPPFIHDLVENSDLTMDQVNQMRADGAGWGNIRIAAELAEKIAAQSEGTETPMTFDEALTSIMNDRSQDIGFGEIAAKYGLKIGELNRQGNSVQVANVKAARNEKPVRMEKMEKPERPEKPERVEKLAKPERPEMPGRGPGR
jgi:hypothetical protein